MFNRIYWIEKIKEKLTLSHISSLGEFKYKRCYHFQDIIKKIYVFKSNQILKGAAFLWGDIAIDEKMLTEYSKNVSDLFFLHEYGHTKMNIIVVIIFSILYAISFGGFIISGIIILFNIIIIVLPFFNFGYNVIYPIIMFALTGIMVSLLSKLRELHAELFALRKMGLPTYCEASSLIKNREPKKSLYKKIRHYFFYHSTDFVIKIYVRI